jgi:hypothetical protein
VHSWRKGRNAGTAFLDDYSLLMQALIELHLSTGDPRWLTEAEQLGQKVQSRFSDDAPGYYYTASDADIVIARSKSGLDDVTPSGNGIAAQAFAQLSQLSAKPEYSGLAEGVVSAFSGQMEQAPLSTESLYIAMAMLADGARSIGDPGKPLDLSAAGVDGELNVTSVQPPVSLTLSADRAAVKPGGELLLTLRVNLEQGYHVNSHSPLQDFLLPTNLSLLPQDGFLLEEPHYPYGEELRPGGSGEPLTVYYDGTQIQARLAVDNGVRPGEYKLAFVAAVQPCNENACQMPQSHEMTLLVKVDKGAKGLNRRVPGGDGEGAAPALTISGAAVALAFLTALLARRKRRKGL